MSIFLAWKSARLSDNAAYKAGKAQLAAPLDAVDHLVFDFDNNPPTRGVEVSQSGLRPMYTNLSANDSYRQHTHNIGQLHQYFDLLVSPFTIEAPDHS